MTEPALDEIVKKLSGIEPDLTALAAHMTDAAPETFDSLVAHDDERVRANGYVLASLARPDLLPPLLERVTDDPSPLVRMQAAASIRNLDMAVRQPSAAVMSGLLRDPDPGVRKFALKAASLIRGEEVQTLVQQIRDEDSEPFLRELAARVARSI